MAHTIVGVVGLPGVDRVLIMHHCICAKCMMLFKPPIKPVRKGLLFLISVSQFRKLRLPKVKVR